MHVYSEAIAPHQSPNPPKAGLPRGIATVAQHSRLPEAIATVAQPPPKQGYQRPSPPSPNPPKAGLPEAIATVAQPPQSRATRGHRHRRPTPPKQGYQRHRLPPSAHNAGLNPDGSPNRHPVAQHTPKAMAPKPIATSPTSTG
ncbi:unnamed protein product [Boreogadus saida]